MGEVILGMPGPWADDNFEEADHYTTKIGGVPDWPCLKSFIKPDLLRCDSCGDNICLVAQIYAPISSIKLIVEERVIYIFACLSATCETKSWRALRVQNSSIEKKSETLSHDSSASPLTTKLQDDPWAFDFDDEEDEIDLDDLGKALTEATTLASASKSKKSNTFPVDIDKCSPVLKVREIDDKTTVLPCFYIYTQEEKYLKDAATLCSNISSLNIQENEIAGNENVPEETWEGESYEYDRSLNADRTYLKFKKRLDLYPQQCFRYSYGGKPLMATAESVVDPGKCMLCGELRHYEMQLMPPLLYYLQEASKNLCLETWNWMSIIVYTCSKGCAPPEKQESDGWVIAEEAIVVQME